MDLECPYCEHEFNINNDDGFGYEEDVNHKIECPECEKSFVFQTSISYYYEAQKADCLNNGKHNFKITATHPREFSQMECQMCGERRELTSKERSIYKIGSKQHYIKSLSKIK